jgi:iron complex transport system ATP-binding protein
MGYLPATRGDIEVLGQRYGGADWREMRQRIGIVSTALAPMLESGEPAWKTILSGKNALLGYYGQPAPEDVERALGILVQLEAGHLETRRWGVLSQGERQRVLIGRALMGRPELLILDEPCAGLDPVARERFLGFLDRWVGRGGVPAIVLVTHHVEEITASFSHALVLRRGRVVAGGPKEQVLSSEILSRAFDAPVQVSSSGGRYTLVIG